MRLTEFMVVIIAALMFLVPTMKKEVPPLEIEAQEEEAPALHVGEGGETFRITYEVQSPREENIADIIWMKKAAEVAKDEGVPYFNVLEQKVGKIFSEKYRQNLSVVEGVIQLDPDPMRAEFDAQEIESLVLTE
jgi:hypothetical protein